MESKQDLYDRAIDYYNSNQFASAETALRQCLTLAGDDEETQHLKESAVAKLCDVLVHERKPTELAALVRELRPFFSVVPKAKTAKLVRIVIDSLARIPGTAELQLTLCNETIAWCRAEKRSFLRIRLELRLATLQLAQGQLPAALATINGVIREVKRLDDKALLVEIHLTESKVYHGLSNVTKARAALTAARTAANAIYVSPEQQREIDLQAGTLHAEERDYKTAYSYFFEAFEAANSSGDMDGALPPLKYMLLSKVMIGAVDDVSAILNGKSGVKYAGRGLEAMRALATAYKHRSLHEFERSLREFNAEISDDPLMVRHLQSLANILLEQNLIRLIEPYSCVEIAHVAQLIQLPLDRVEAKLGHMILDKKISGTLDQGRGQLLLFDRAQTDKSYDAALKTITHLGDVIDILQRRADTAVGFTAVTAPTKNQR